MSAGLLFLAVGSGIGLYFLYAFSFNPIILSLLIISVVTVLTYSSKLAGWGVGELVVGLNFGPLLAAGVYFIQAGTITLEPLLIGGVLGILTAGILYINQFPDTEADSSKGRLHLVARMGKERAAGAFKYLIASAYILIVLGVVLSVTPPFTLIALATIPKARLASRILTANSGKIMELIPAMGNTVMVTLQTGILLVVAYVAWGLVSPFLF